LVPTFAYTFNVDARLRCEVSKVVANDDDHPAGRSTQSPRIPDLVDFVASQVGIDLTTIRKLSLEETFIGVLSAWPALRGLAGTLGYMAWHYMRHRGHSEVGLSDNQAVDCVRLGFHCSNLPANDARHIVLDWQRSKSIFPELFSVERASKAHDEAVLDELGTFAVTHPLRLAPVLAVRMDDEDSYIEFWIARARGQIERHLANERFVAGLDAMSKGLLTFHGLLEKVYGPEYCDRVLAPKAYALFDELDRALTARVVATLANHVNEGRLAIKRDLEKEYPDIYEFYQPEYYGARRLLE
jgi:hypothetical protein